MKTQPILLILCLATGLVSCNDSAEPVKDYPITPVDFAHVNVQPGFWQSRIQTANKVTIPFAFEKCEETGRIDNFIHAGGIKEGKFRGRYGFDDSDVYNQYFTTPFARVWTKNNRNGRGRKEKGSALEKK